MFKKLQKMMSSEELRGLYPIKDRAFKERRDGEIKAVLSGDSDKFLVVVGPCSLDDEGAIFEYLGELKKIEDVLKDRMLIVPRLFSAKPRTLGGYRGLMHEEDGLKKVRRVLAGAVNDFEFCGADELLYPFSYEYFFDAISYYTIGARSAVNQEHRFFSSGIDVAVGIKNPLNGDINLLKSSIEIAKKSSVFYYDGMVVETSGNPYAHAILRGYQDKRGEHANNMDSVNLLDGIPVIMDLGHSNAKKSHVLIEDNYKKLLRMLSNKNIKGVMIESYLKEGRSDNPAYGQSITDACLSLRQTKNLLLDLHEKLI